MPPWPIAPGLLFVALAGSVDERLALAAALRPLRLAAVPLPPEGAAARALAGELVTGVEEAKGPRRVWGVTVLDLPIERFWGAINDEEGKVRFTPLDYQVLLRGAPCGPERVAFQYAGGGALTDRWWVLEQRVNTALHARTDGRVRELVWKSVTDVSGLLDAEARVWAEQGMQIPSTEGAWLLVDLGDGRTLVEYSSRTDAGGWVPDGIGASFAAAGLRDNFENLRRLAVEGAGCTEG